MKLTIKQEKFVNFYVELGQASAAARKAGYCAKYAGSNADRLLKKKTIAAAIRERMDALAETSIAKSREVLEHLTAVLRGEIQEEVLIVEGTGNGESVARIIKKQVSEKDRLKAAELLAKRYGLLTEKMKFDITPVVIGGEEDLQD